MRSSPRFSAVLWLLLVCVVASSCVWCVCAEYDVMRRYDVPRPEGGRHFWLYSPTAYQHSTAPSPLPLALFFHGYTDTCELQGYISQFSIWAYVAEVQQYHIAVMCGTNPGPGWNSGGRGNGTGQPDDIQYTRAALAVIQKAVRVREGHVFAMGHSNGAMMYHQHTTPPHTSADPHTLTHSHARTHPLVLIPCAPHRLRLCVSATHRSELLACNASDIITAIASNAGTTALGPSVNASLAWCSAGYGSNTTSILKLHGTADQSVAYNGTTSSPGAVADLQAWGERNQCDGPMRKLWTRGIAVAQGWTSCAGHTEVELVSLTGVNHQWLITSDFQSSTYVFEFFNRVARRRQSQLQQREQLHRLAHLGEQL